MPGIVIFDVDGTLTATTGVDDACLCTAWERILGLRDIDSDWDHYRHSTDEGLTIEACERGLDRRPTPDEMRRVKAEFFSLLHERTEANAACCRPVPGVHDLLRSLRETGWRIGLASGAWEESARIKLRRARVDVSGLPGTFSHARADGEPATREEIVGATLRALEAFESTTPPRKQGATRPVYVGDGPWDARAARNLRLGFVGVRLDGREDRLRREGAERIIANFTDLAGTLAAIQHAAAAPPEKHP